jgi:hypothetical protein
VPLYEMTEIEKSQMRNTDADTDTKLVGLGAISQEEVRQRVAADPDTPYVDLDETQMPEGPAAPPQGSPDMWAKLGEELKAKPFGEVGMWSQLGQHLLPKPVGGQAQVWSDLAQAMTPEPATDVDKETEAFTQLGQSMGLLAMDAEPGVTLKFMKLADIPFTVENYQKWRWLEDIDDPVRGALAETTGDAFDPSEKRVTKGGKGAGEWTKGAAGGASPEPKKGARVTSGLIAEWEAAGGRGIKPDPRVTAAPSKEDIESQERTGRLFNAGQPPVPEANLEGETPEAKAKTARIREVAKSMGLDPAKFYYGGPAPTTELAGMSGETLGATFGQPTVWNGKRFPPGVVIFDPPPEAAKDGLAEISPATIAHEGMHVKFAAVMHAMSEEAEKITPRELNEDGTLIVGAVEDHPIYALLAPYIAWGFEGKTSEQGMPLMLRKLADEDGVTPYSRAYWRQWYEADGNMDPWLPINETLAEIANVHYAKPGEGGMSEGYEFRALHHGSPRH